MDDPNAAPGSSIARRLAAFPWRFALLVVACLLANAFVLGSIVDQMVKTGRQSGAELSTPVLLFINYGYSLCHSALGVVFQVLVFAGLVGAYARLSPGSLGRRWLAIGTVIAFAALCVFYVLAWRLGLVLMSYTVPKVIR